MEREDGRGETDDGGRRTEDGGRRTGDGGRGTEDGELRTDMGEPIQSFKELRVYQLACDPHALAWTSCRLCSEGRGDEREIREVGPEVTSVGGGLGERMAPPFPAGLASLQENHHRRIKRGSHGSFGLEGSSTGPRSSSRTVSAPTIGQGSCHCSPKCSHASGEIVFVAFRKGAFSSNSKTSPGFR